MSDIENLLIEDILLPNINGAAYFILLYEHFEDTVINSVKDFYSMDLIMDGNLYSDIDDSYINKLKSKIAAGETGEPIPYTIELNDAIRKKEKYKKEVIDLAKKEKDGKRFWGSLIWLINNQVFSNKERLRITEIRKRRNTVVHELLRVLENGLTEKDAKMIADLLEFNLRINKWHFQKVDAQIMCDEIPAEAQIENAVGYDDVALMGVFRILFCNEGQQFKEEIEKVNKQ